MSSFKIEGKKFLVGIFPEWVWDELKSDVYDQVVEKLSEIDQLKSDVVDYMKENQIRIGFHTQYKSGGGWTVSRNITLAPKDKEDPLKPHVLSLIIHEIFHVKQSIWMRLSMQGELKEIKILKYQPNVRY